MKKISIIVPFYFDAANVPVTVSALLAVKEDLSAAYSVEFIFIDDGSRDSTFAELARVYQQHSRDISVLKLSRNFGSTNAVLAGMTYATGDAQVFFPSDLQTSPSLIGEMLEAWEGGTPVVYAHRTGRDESLYIRATARLYHWLISKALPDSPRGGFDSFLLDRCVIEDILKNTSANEYLPSLIMWLGYPTQAIPYHRRKREIGTSKWTLGKKLNAFFDSFLGYSYIPIRLFILVGIFFGIAGLAYLVLIILSYFWGGNDERGWTSLMSAVLITASLNFLFLGILGEYVWRILSSVQGRSNFIIEKDLRKID